MNKEFDYKKYFDDFVKDNYITATMDFHMPEGYETANGMYDENNTLYINKKVLENASKYEKAFYLFHELRHAMQYTLPSCFSNCIQKSLGYVIQYDGTCYRRVGEDYLECRLEDSKEDWKNLYLGQPHEVDANTYAYERVKKIFGDSQELERLYDFWMPKKRISEEEYLRIFKEIDSKTGDAY